MQFDYQEAITQQFGNKYLNPKFIGEGAFSKVYQCQNTEGDPVAIKVVNLKVVKPHIIPYLKNEVELLRENDNENVIKLYEAQETSSALFLVLEFCAFDVKYMMKQYFKNKLPEDLVIVILKQLVNGLHYLHGRNIIHRDLKLDNIGVVIQPEDLIKLQKSQSNLNQQILQNATFKLLDLGLAKQFVNQTTTITFAGTEVNMAPEVLERKPYSYEADIYSLGVCLYQMITGEYPYYNKQNKKEQFQLIQQQDANFELIENEKLRNFIQQMLKYNVKERLTFQQLYQSPYLFNPNIVSQSLLEKSLIKNSEFYNYNQQKESLLIPNQQISQFYSQQQQFEQKQFSQQHLFFEQFNKPKLPRESIQESSYNQQNEEQYIMKQKQRSSIGKPQLKIKQNFEKGNQLKNICMLIQHLCESLFDMILTIPDILKYHSFEGEFYNYLQYFSNLGQAIFNQLNQEIDSQSYDNSDNQQFQLLKNSLQTFQFNFEYEKCSKISSHIYKFRTFFNQIESIEKKTEYINLGYSNNVLQKNNQTIFKQILSLLQSIYYQEQKLEQNEYEQLNEFNCKLYQILIKITLFEAVFQPKFFSLQDDLIKCCTPQNDPDQLCCQLSLIMDKYEIQYDKKY